MIQRIASVLILMLAAFSAGAQPTQLSSFGHDFYAAYMKTSMDCAAITPFQSTWVVVCSPYPCNISVSYFDQETGQEFLGGVYQIQSKSFIQIPVSLANVVVHDNLTARNKNGDGEVPEYTAIHVHTDKIATVSYFSTGPDDAAMYCVFPEHVLGKHYVVAAAPNDDGTGGGTPRNCSGSPEPSSSFFGVLAVNDSTRVTITPSGTSRHGVIGATSGPNSTGTLHPFSITLRRGQVYWVKSDTASHPGVWDIDMTGSQIESDKPVAAFAGCENAFNGVTALGINDNRNLSLQMMVPYDYWASSGYLVMPMKDTPNINPSNNSAGDQVKVVVADKSQLGCVVTKVVQSDTTPMSVQPYQFPTLTFDNVIYGANIASTCEQKISVEQYDYRAIESRAERMATAPTQINVTPYKSFARTFEFSVPDDVLQVAKFRFINVIARADQFSKIQVWKDGKAIGPVSGLTSQGSTTFPGYPQLKGVCYAVGVGNYYLTGDSAFAVYQYGMSAYDYPDKDLGDFDNDDYFHAYATAAGQMFSSGAPSSLKVDLKTNCASWDLTASGSATAPLAMIEILNDPLGILDRMPDSASGYVSNNVSFAPTAKFHSGDTSASLTLIPTNPALNADGWLLVQDKTGQSFLLHLSYTAPKLLLSAKDSNRVDSISFMHTYSGQEKCGAFVLRNGDSRTFQISNAFMALGGQNVFRISSINKSLPFTLYPQDSLVVNVCYNSTATTQTFFDTLLIVTECTTFALKLSGSSGAARIQAFDRDFGTIPIGDTTCEFVRIKNAGTADLVLKGLNLKNTGTSEFIFPNGNSMPSIIRAGGSIDLSICFIPKDTVLDSAVITWLTDVPAPADPASKSYTILQGRGFGIPLSDVREHVAPFLALTTSPNPVSTELTIAGDLDHAGAVMVQMLDILGNEVKRIDVGEVTAGDFVRRVDIRSLPAGAYILRITTSDNSITRRIVKSR